MMLFSLERSIHMNRFSQKANVVYLTLTLCMMLSSCLGIELETVFHDDGSGFMTMKFTVSKELLEMGDEQAGVDIPFTKEDLEEEYRAIDGVTVEEIYQEETDADRIITAKLSFEDFNKLSENDEFPGEDATLTTNGRETVLRMLIGQPRGTTGGEATDEQIPEMDEAMISMIQSFMEGYSLEYRIVAPKKITKYSHGELSKDRKTINFFIPMGDFIMIEEPYYLEVAW